MLRIWPHVDTQVSCVKSGACIGNKFMKVKTQYYQFLWFWAWDNYVMNAKLIVEESVHMIVSNWFQVILISVFLGR